MEQKISGCGVWGLVVVASLDGKRFGSETDAVFACGFGFIHGGVGTCDQLLR